MDNLTYEKRILIRSEQVDMTRKLRISELFRLMEEASIAHTEELGCTREFTLDRGLLWIITRQQAEIRELPAYDEEIIVRSWQGDMMHVFFPRFYEICRGDEVLVRGQALWMLIDEESRDMVMPEEYGIEIPGRPGSDDMMIPAVTIPASAGEPFASEELVTRYSQVDINGHMNNTRYFDIIDDALFKEPDAAGDRKVPRRILANYLSELRLGDRFTLNGYRQQSESGSESSLSESQCSESLFFEGTGDKPMFRVRLDY